MTTGNRSPVLTEHTAAAGQTGSVDPETAGRRHLGAHPTEIDRPLGPSEEVESGAELDALLCLVHDQTGLDLRGYRRLSLERRVKSRLHKLGYRSRQQYLDLLKTDPNECVALIEHVTIKVSRFFRNSLVYTQLRDSVLPQLLADLAPDAELRIWSAGCGKGEEPYTLLMILNEIGKQSWSGPVSIYGTDIDNNALASARRGLYPPNSLEETPAGLIAKYFLIQGGRYGPLWEFDPALREKVTFLQHNLLTEVRSPALLPFDLILCRNVLIYFDKSAQGQVFDLLTASLAPGGCLCLGEAEQLPGEQATSFNVVDHRARLYTKKAAILASKVCNHVAP